MLALATGLGAGAGLVWAGFHGMAPRSQAFGRTFVGDRSRTRELSLTFDDGPNDPHTFRLLDVLAMHGVKATFFMVGKYVDQRPDIARAVAEAGHVIGNHTYTHPNLIFQLEWQLRDEISRCERALSDAVGRHSNLFRPPFGGRRPITLRAVRSMGMLPVMWNVTGWDWNATSSAHIVTKVSSQVRGGDVMLLHDGGHLAFGTDRSLTVEAVNTIVGRYKGKGYSFKAIPEMMGDSEQPK
ncbi:MAG: polysaccharide deacetylase family protein [Terriglobales bacterium]